MKLPPNYVDLYEQKRKAIKSFGIRISPLLKSTNIKLQNIEKHFTPNIPAWCMKQPEILFDLHSGNKSESYPHILKYESESCKVVIRIITNKFILMGQRKTQRLVVLFYQTSIVVCNVYLSIQQFSLLKPKQSI